MKLGRIFFVCGVCFIFLVIYQHNLIIKLNYAKQRLIQKKDKLQRERNELMKELCQAKDLHKVKMWAQDELGMTDVKMSHVFTLTAGDGEDFYRTPTFFNH